MRKFAELFWNLDSTTSTKRKRQYLVNYFKGSAPKDIGWAVFFLTGQRLKRVVKSRDLRKWALEKVGLSDWLFEECYAAVGDIAETISLLIETPTLSKGFSTASLSEWVETRLSTLLKMPEDQQKAQVYSWWEELSNQEILVVNKLLTGGFRIGVSKLIVENAIADWLEIAPSIIAHRLMGQWKPSENFVAALTSSAPSGSESDSQPYPFYLASPLETQVADLGDPQDWIIEWKWDGIRAQIIKRNDLTFIWSRGEELITDNFPELKAQASELPNGTVLDGEIVAWSGGQVQPFSSLQRRIARKKITPKILEEIPVKFIVFDCLENKAEDIRSLPLSDRRKRVVELIDKENSLFVLSQQHLVGDWSEAASLRDSSRERYVEGLMLKRKDSIYKTGRKRGEWWKWKIDPYSIDTVLIYAQAGHGRRANLYTDYTFAVWNDEQLVPVAKAYSGLDDTEIAELDKWIRSHTKEKFGPIRSVTPHFVFELGFEGIAESSRHKSGVALRFPRILRWRRDKRVDQADTITNVRKLIHVPNSH